MTDASKGVRSPNHRLAFELRAESDVPTFDVEFDDVPVMRACRLGLVLAEHDLSGLTLGTVSDVDAIQDGYRLVGSETRIRHRGIQLRKCTVWALVWSRHPWHRIM